MAMEPSQAQVTPEKVRSILGMRRNLFGGRGGCCLEAIKLRLSGA